MNTIPVDTAPAACPVCNFASSRPALIAHNTHGRHVVDRDEAFHLLHCTTCDALFIGGVAVDQAFYDRYYDSGYYDPAPPKGLRWATRPATFLARWSAERKAAICRRALKRSVRPIRLLDFGCGAGDFLSGLDQSAFHAQGIEINPAGRAACRGKGLTVDDSLPLVPPSLEMRFDIITMWHVLEHLPTPQDTLLSLRHFLRPGGAIVIAVPNHRSLGFRAGGADWFHLDSPRHLFIPSQTTIEHLASATGMNVTSCLSQWYDYPLDLWWSTRSSPYRAVIRMLYPLFKICSRETALYVLQAP